MFPSFPSLFLTLQHDHGSPGLYSEETMGIKLYVKFKEHLGVLWAGSNIIHVLSCLLIFPVVLPGAFFQLFSQVTR